MKLLIKFIDIDKKSLYYISKTNTMLYVNCISVLKKKEKHIKRIYIIYK